VGLAAEPLRALRRGLARGAGFGLYVAVFKTPAQRNQLIASLQEGMPTAQLQTVTIRPDSTDILDEILKQVGESTSAPVMVVGFENVFSSDTESHPILRSLNLRRPDWPLLLKQPVVFWVPEYLLGILSRAAPDFLDWRTDTLHFPGVEMDQLQMLDSAIWEGGLDTRMPIEARIERVKELEARIAANEHSSDRVILSTVGSWLNELGLHLNWLGRMTEARDCFQKAATLFRGIRDQENEAIALGNLGDAYRLLSDADKALEFYDQALALSRASSSRHVESMVLGNFGIISHNKGEFQKAIEYLEQQLKIAREIGDRRGESVAMEGLALAYKELKEFVKSNELHEQALLIYREIGDRRGEANVLGNLGVNYKIFGDLAKAVEFQARKLAIVRKIGDRRGEASAIGNLGSIFFETRELHKAIDLFEQHIGIAKEIVDRKGECLATYHAAICYAHLNILPRAIELFDQAYNIAREIGDKRAEANSVGLSALISDSLDDREQAVKRAEAALQLSGYLDDSLAASIRAKLGEWRQPGGKVEAGVVSQSSSGAN
jgi:tetratricopeptide (TPR) repeat protein